MCTDELCLETAVVDCLCDGGEEGDVVYMESRGVSEETDGDVGYAGETGEHVGDGSDAGGAGHAANGEGDFVWCWGVLLAERALLDMLWTEGGGWCRFIEEIEAGIVEGDLDAREREGMGVTESDGLVYYGDVDRGRRGVEGSEGALDGTNTAGWFESDRSDQEK